jgi:hypothetical protein
MRCEDKMSVKLLMPFKRRRMRQFLEQLPAGLSGSFLRSSSVRAFEVFR